MSSDAAANGSPYASPVASTRSVKTRSRRLPAWAWAVLIAWVAAVALVRNLEILDPGIVNIITLIVTFLAGMSVFIWFCFFSGYGKHLRMGLLLVSLLCVAGSAACLKIVSVSGELIPSFRPRWAATPDRALASSVGASSVETATAPASEPTQKSVDSPDDFPQFLGPKRSCWIPGPGLSSDWTAHPPTLRWRQPIGAGWSSFSVVDGHAVTQEQRGEEECVTCYEVLTGKLTWLHADRARHDTTLGGVGPRATPTIHQGRVFALGATGILNCLDAATGDPLWMHRLQEEYGLTPETDLSNLAWGRSGSPLIVDDLVVVPAGGPADGRKVSLVAFRQDTGNLVWEGGDSQIAYTSPSLVTLAGVRQIMIVNEKTVTGHDPESGNVLWSFDWPGCSTQNASNSQAVAVDDDRVFISKGYGGGSDLFQVRRDTTGQWTTESLWAASPVKAMKAKLMKTKFTNVVIRAGCVYGISDGTLECIDLAGKRRWKQGRYGHGQILGVDDLLIVQAESGEVFLVAATPDGHHELAHLAALEGKTWNNPVLYGRNLLVRNGEQAACFELPVAEK